MKLSRPDDPWGVERIQRILSASTGVVRWPRALRKDQGLESTKKKRQEKSTGGRKGKTRWDGGENLSHESKKEP